MATAFSESERREIIRQLQSAAWKRAATTGMKTTVEQLASDAGISKGAFYRFYDSKEHLFLDMIECWHRHLYEHAGQILATRGDLPGAERATLVLTETLHLMQERPLYRFLAYEAPIMFRRLPEELVKDHWQSDEEFIRTLIRRAGVKLTIPEDTACAAIRILFLSLLSAERIGPRYDEAANELIRSACHQLIVP